jgi:hypothetical protein
MNYDREHIVNIDGPKIKRRSSFDPRVFTDRDDATREIFSYLRPNSKNSWRYPTLGQFFRDRKNYSKIMIEKVTPGLTEM